jgi:signal transduction histidine kinase
MLGSLVERYHRLARIELLVVVIVTAIVFVGWFFNIEDLQTGPVRSSRMQPLTGIACITSALALWCLMSSKNNLRRVGKIIASLVIAVGVVRFAFPGLSHTLAISTSICLYLTGLSLLLHAIKFRNNILIADWCAILVTLLSFGALIGYIYEDDGLYTLFGKRSMSLPTAISYFLLSTSILLFRSETGMLRIFTKHYPGSRMARYLVPIALLLPIATGLLRKYAFRGIDTSSSFSFGFIIMINVVFMVFLIWRGALSMNRSWLDLEKERKRAEQLFARLLKEETRMLKQTLMETQIRQQKELIQASIDGQEKQKKEIGMELHDHINQVLASTKLYLELARSDEKKRLEIIEKCRDQVLYAINEIRNLSRSLVLPETGRESIIDNIAALVNNLQQSSGLNISTQIDTEILKSLDKKKQVSIYRILEEQLQNVVKHAKASHVHINLWHDRDALRMIFFDNGRGFDVHNYRKGIGLNNISSRVASMDGELDIVSAPGEGCELRIAVPAPVEA